MKTNNRLSKDNNSSDVKLRPMVKETITEHKYMNCETKEICWFDLSTGPKWFETTHYPVNDETRTREVERPMNDTEYIEYLEKENQELKDNNEALAVEFNRLNEVLDKERQDQFLKVVESVIQNQIEQAQNPTMMVMLNWMKEHLLQEIKSAMEKVNNNG